MDKDKEPITAEEFWRQKYRPETEKLTGEEYIVFDGDDVREYAVLFAKHHRERMIEAVKAEVKTKFSYELSIRSQNQIDLLIENAYSEDRIK